MLMLTLKTTGRDACNAQAFALHFVTRLAGGSLVIHDLLL